MARRFEDQGNTTRGSVCMSSSAEALALVSVRKRKPGHVLPTKTVKWRCQVRERREALNLTAASVAKAVGLSQAGLCAIEHGKELRYSTAKRIADFFNTTTDELWHAL